MSNGSGQAGERWILVLSGRLLHGAEAMAMRQSKLDSLPYSCILILKLERTKGVVWRKIEARFPMLIT